MDSGFYGMGFSDCLSEVLINETSGSYAGSCYGNWLIGFPFRICRLFLRITVDLAAGYGPHAVLIQGIFEYDYTNVLFYL